jgi:hypothetical protein
MSALGSDLVERLRLWRHAARTIAGRRLWIAPLLPLLWLAFQIVRLLVPGWRPEDFTPAEAQNFLIGVPLTVLGAGFGVRIIAGELDQRTLEIAYTVPGGAHRVWLAKLAAATGLLLLGEAVLAAVTFFFCTSFTVGTLYGALQSALFYAVLAMALAVLFKSEATGAMVTVVVAIANFFIHELDWRISPFWNPAALGDYDPADVLAWTVQNRIGFALAIAAITALAFVRAERREKLLGG